MSTPQPWLPPRPDPAALQADLAAFRLALSNYFRKRVASEEVDDLVQDVFVNMLARRAPGLLETVQVYTFSVAPSVLYRHLSHARRSAPGREADVEDTQHARAPSAEHEVLAVEGLRRMLEAVATLPPRTQAIFALHRFEEISYPIIAQQLGITVSAVEKHIMAALKVLRAQVEAQ